MTPNSIIKDTISEVLDIHSGIVDFKTFVESPEYLGLTGVYDWWFDKLNGVVGSSTSRAIFRGSTGAGKSTIMNLVLLYKIYLLFSQGSDVAKTLRLMPGTEVFCLYFSVSMRQAQKSGFAQMRNFIDGSKWFNTFYPRRKDIDSSIQFSNHFTIDFASGVGHQIGLNVWGFILDEANFRKENGEGSSEDFDSVFYLASQLENRLAQRFLRDGVENFFAGYISSASYETAFIQDKGDDYKDDPNAIVLDPVLYKVDPLRYSKNRFEVFFGFGELSPCVVKDSEHRALIKSQLAKLEIPEDKQETFFEKVPLELKKQFLENTYLAIQNICGRPTALKGSFVTNYDIIKESYTSTVPSPFIQDSVTVSNKDEFQIESILRPEDFDKPHLPHSLFLDLSVQGDFGSLTCVRYDGQFGGVKYHTHIFTLEIIPPEFPAATDITKVQNFVIRLASVINIVAFGSDQYQSSQLRQNVSKELDIPDIRISLDSTDIPHLAWMSACASHRFKMKYYERLDREITEAVHNTKKRRVEKRKGSSDDQFQTVVGAFYLSDTVASSEVVFEGGRANIVGANEARRLLSASGFNTGSALDPTTLTKRAQYEVRKKERAASKLSAALDELNSL